MQLDELVHNFSNHTSSGNPSSSDRHISNIHTPSITFTPSYGTHSPTKPVPSASISPNELGVSPVVAEKSAINYERDLHATFRSHHQDEAQLVHGIRHRSRSPISTAGNSRINRGN